MEKKEKITMLEALTEQYNNFIAKLIANTLDLQRHIDIASVEPDYKRSDQMGRMMSVNDMIESYKKGVQNSQHYLKIISDLLTAKDDIALEAKIDQIQKYEVKKIIAPAKKDKQEIHGK